MRILILNFSFHINCVLKARRRLGGDCASLFCRPCALVPVFAPWTHFSWCGVTFIAGCPLGFVVYLFFCFCNGLFSLASSLSSPPLHRPGAGAAFEQIWSEGKGVAALDYWCACRRKFSSDACWRKSACLWPLWGLTLTGYLNLLWKGGWTCVSVWFQWCQGGKRVSGLLVPVSASPLFQWALLNQLRDICTLSIAARLDMWSHPLAWTHTVYISWYGWFTFSGAHTPTHIHSHPAWCVYVYCTYIPNV